MNPSQQKFHEKFLRAAQSAGRDVAKIKILAVSKGQTSASIEAFLKSDLSFWGLGESYLNELVLKQQELSRLPQKLAWHFIGRLQSRKIQELIAHVDVLHSVSRSKELEIMAKTPRDFFVQVNVSDEDSKNGCLPREVPLLLANVERLGLKRNCLGFMALPSILAESSEVQVRREMGELRNLRDRLFPEGLLNMGTSGDFEIAIAEGADVIRIGSALFGERASK